MAVLETPRRPAPPSRDGAVAIRRIALAGNPNAGKTTLFNALTGLKQRVGNYPGVTVDKKEGRLALRDGDAVLLDLPGTYSLSPKSPDEAIARDVLLGLREDTAAPDAVVIVVDASNLERNLFLATQILELGLPSIVALNMTDVAKTHGKAVNAAALSRELGVGASCSRTSRSSERTTIVFFGAMITTQRISPNSSAATAMMKSVWASGSVHFTPPFPMPTPRNPPSWMALVA